MTEPRGFFVPFRVGASIEPKKLKKCSRCHELQPIAAFAKNKTLRDGLAQMCKTCDRARKKKRLS
jgi:hypothetical protein